jgi:hypothetical protein
VSYPINPNTAPDWVRVAVGPDGHLHVTWVEYQLPEGFPPQGIYYAQSGDGGLSWSTPREMAPSGYNQGNVMVSGENVYVAYLGIASVGGRYLVESLDNGRTWQEPETLAPAGGAGTTGAIQLAVDSTGSVHAVYTDIACVFHRQRLPDGWTEPECVSSPEATRALKEYPAMTIGLGNQIHVLYYTDRKQLWYTTRTLDAPAIAPLPVPTLAPPTPTVPLPTATIAVTPTYLPDFGPAPDLGATARVSVLSIVAGVAPVVIFFGGLLFARSLRKK